jgi:hypothetical protein
MSAGKSIWKPMKFTGKRDHHSGPSFRVAKVEAEAVAYYDAEEGVTFFFEIQQRQLASYTLAEMKALHRALGTMLTKIETDPKP